MGTLADLNTFSLHPVKHITTGEGFATLADDVLDDGFRRVGIVGKEPLDGVEVARVGGPLQRVELAGFSL